MLNFFNISVTQPLVLTLPPHWWSTFTQRPEKETRDVKQTEDVRQTEDMRQTGDIRKTGDIKQT